MSSPSRARSWMVLLAAIVGVVITARAGFWQLDRAAQKVALQTSLDSRGVMPALPQAQLARTLAEAEAQHYRHVTLRGRWLPERTVFLENRQMAGRTGFYVVTPLLLSGAGKGEAVLVQRGFAPRDQLDRTRLPAVPSPAGDVEVIGLIAPPPSRLYEFSAVASGAIRQNLDPAEFATETGLALRPVSVLQADAADNANANTSASASDGLLRQWPLPAVDVQKHYGYAFQWFAMASTMTGLYVWFQLIRPRLRRRT